MKLTKELVILALNKSLENASTLIDDADLLKNHERYSRSYTLYQLASEEIGKASICMYFLLNDNYHDDNRSKKFLKHFSNHILKSEALLIFRLPFIFIQYANQPQKIMAALADIKTVDLKQRDNFKNYSLYTSFKDGSVITPRDIISKEMAIEMQRSTKESQIIINIIFKKNLENLDELIKSHKENSNETDFSSLLKSYFQVTQHKENF